MNANVEMVLNLMERKELKKMAFLLGEDKKFVNGWSDRIFIRTNIRLSLTEVLELAEAVKYD